MNEHKHYAVEIPGRRLGISSAKFSGLHQRGKQMALKLYGVISVEPYVYLFRSLIPELADSQQTAEPCIERVFKKIRKGSKNQFRQSADIRFPVYGQIIPAGKRQGLLK